MRLLCSLLICLKISRIYYIIGHMEYLKSQLLQKSVFSVSTLKQKIVPLFSLLYRKKLAFSPSNLK